LNARLAGGRAVATRRTHGCIVQTKARDPALGDFGISGRRRDLSQAADGCPNYYRAINNVYNDFALVARKVELFLFMQVIREPA
jgi:hypothetical protein